MVSVLVSVRAVVVRHTMAGPGGAAITAWWRRWNAGVGSQSVAAPRVAEWRRVVADADHADPVVPWWMAGGHGPVPRPDVVWPLVP